MHSFVLCWHVLCGIYSSILFIFRRFVSLLEDLLKKIFSFSKRKYISFLDFPWCSIRCIFTVTERYFQLWCSIRCIFTVTEIYFQLWSDQRKFQPMLISFWIEKQTIYLKVEKVYCPEWYILNFNTSAK